MLGDLYDTNDEPSKAISVLQEAQAAYEILKEPNLQGVYVILGNAYYGKSDFGKSLFYLLKALKTAHAQGDTSMQLCNINNSLVGLYSAIGNYEMSTKYLQEALRTARKYKDDGAIFFLSTNLAINYDKIGRSERGLEVLDSIPESYRLSLNAKNKALIQEIYLRSYLSLKQYDKGQPLIEPLLKASEG